MSCFNIQVWFPGWHGEFLHLHTPCFRSCVSLRVGSGSGVCTETGPAVEDASSTLSPSGTRWQPGVSVLLRGYGTRHSSAAGQKQRGTKETRTFAREMTLKGKGDEGKPLKVTVFIWSYTLNINIPLSYYTILQSQTSRLSKGSSQHFFLHSSSFSFALLKRVHFTPDPVLLSTMSNLYLRGGILPLVVQLLLASQYIFPALLLLNTAGRTPVFYLSGHSKFGWNSVQIQDRHWDNIQHHRQRSFR